MQVLMYWLRISYLAISYGQSVPISSEKARIQFGKIFFVKKRKEKVKVLQM